MVRADDNGHRGVQIGNALPDRCERIRDSASLVGRRGRARHEYERVVRDYESTDDLSHHETPVDERPSFRART